jgi:hypothetical protein
LDQVIVELKDMFGNITKQEIDSTQALISAPLGHFLDFRDFCSNLYLNVFSEKVFFTTKYLFSPYYRKNKSIFLTKTLFLSVLYKNKNTF